MQNAEICKSHTQDRPLNEANQLREHAFNFTSSDLRLRTGKVGPSSPKRKRAKTSIEYFIISTEDQVSKPMTLNIGPIGHQGFKLPWFLDEICRTWKGVCTIIQCLSPTVGRNGGFEENPTLHNMFVRSVSRVQANNCTYELRMPHGNMPYSLFLASKDLSSCLRAPGAQ